MRRVSLLAGLLLACAVTPAPAEAGSARQDRVEREILRQVNAIRAEHGLHELRRHNGLARAADDKAQEVLATQVFSHASPDGTPMEERVRRYVRAKLVGEALGSASVRARQAERIVDGWMASPVHRAALLDPAFRRAGVGRRKGRLGERRLAVVALDLASSP